jgi:hypothetical protein
VKFGEKLVPYDWSANIEIIRCVHTLKSFFNLIDKLKRLIFGPDFAKVPRSYQGAYIQVQSILDEQIEEIRPPYTKSSLRIDRRAAAILRFESDILMKHLRRISRRTRNMLKWLKLGLKSADVLLGTLQSFFQPLAFVKEFKEQMENLVPEAESPEKSTTKLFNLAPKATRRSRVRKQKTRPKNKRISIIT